MARRIIAAVTLIGLGLALFGSQVSADPGRMAFGLVLLLLWGGSGFAVLAGRSRGRLIGLALSVVGVVVAIWETGQAGPGGSLFLVDVFFVARDPHFAWINVAAASFVFATLSAIAGVLLVLPFAPRLDEATGLPRSDPPSTQDRP